MDKSINLKKLIDYVSDYNLLNLDSVLKNKDLNKLFDSLNIDFNKDLSDLGMLFYDVKNGYYNVGKKVYISLSLLIVYLLCPEEILEPLIGKKNFLKSILFASFVFVSVKDELNKYRLFLNDNMVLLKNDLGNIIYFKHRCNQSLSEDLWIVEKS